MDTEGGQHSSLLGLFAFLCILHAGLMSICPSIILLENTNNSIVGTFCSETSNDSILSGRDSPNSVMTNISAITAEPTSFLSRSVGCSNIVNHNSHFSTVRTCARTLYTMKYAPQSGDTRIESSASADVKANITTFGDDNAGIEDGFITDRDDTYYCADSPDFNTALYFARPIKVASVSWTVGTLFTFSQYAIFKLFWTQKRNVNRLATYRNLKCDMCVKILINGSPFHYGTLMANVIPDFKFDALRNIAGTELACVRASHTPHILLDPTTSTGGCLRLPYTHRFNAFDATDTNRDELVDAGNLFIRELVPLQHVSGVVEPITITVMAWAENVVLGAPTSRAPIGLVPQSGDEYGDGVISRPVFALADFLKHLTAVPYIGKYALVTSMGAQKMGLVAKIFGFSKPNVVSDIDYMKNRKLPNFASATQHDPIFKGTFDDKQEVTVDSRVVGLSGQDEMSIVNLAMRPSYMHQFNWTQSAVSDTDLANIAVTPQLYRLFNNAGNNEIHMAPMGWVTNPFQYWRGTLKFRFVLVASTFHRGRLRIVYEPVFANTATGLDYNTNLTYIWDISENKEATVEVGWHSPKQYLETMPLATLPLTYTTTPTTVPLPVLPLAPIANGYLSVQVVNELTAPDTNLSSPVTVLVYVSATEDFEVFSPTNEIAKISYIPQSGIDEHPMSPMSSQVHAVFGNKGKFPDPTPLIYHGDSVKSLRVLMKRYSLYRNWVFASPGAGRVALLMNTSAYPLMRGKASDGVDSATIIVANPYNYCNTTAVQYFTPGFLAKRGGIRNRLVSMSDAKLVNASLQRSAVPVFTKTTTAVTGATANTLTGNYANQLTASALSGGSVVPDLSLDTLDLESPFHDNARYLPGRATTATTISAKTGIIFQAQINSVAADLLYPIAHYVSAADDYSLMGFIDVPIMYFVPTHPSPA